MTGYSGYYTNGGYISTNYQTNGNDISTFLPTFRFTNNVIVFTLGNTTTATTTFTEINNYPSTFIFTTSGTSGSSVYINTTTYRCGDWVTGGTINSYSPTNIGYSNNVATGSNLGYTDIINYPYSISFSLSNNTLTFITIPVGTVTDMSIYSASITILS